MLGMILIFQAVPGYCKQHKAVKRSGRYDFSYMRCGKLKGGPLAQSPSLTAVSFLHTVLLRSDILVT